VITVAYFSREVSIIQNRGHLGPIIPVLLGLKPILSTAASNFLSYQRDRQKAPRVDTSLYIISRLLLSARMKKQMR